MKVESFISKLYMLLYAVSAVAIASKGPLMSDHQLIWFIAILIATGLLRYEGTR